MEETELNKTSASTTASRKRRSSILKNQRPARTPLSELEFNVTTPPETTKSRRVSFSRRTGVAEFVTNEATTTWKNFYEEHNKSLESSNNDSELKPRRQSQPLGRLGRNIFEEQFQEVEANFDNVSGLCKQRQYMDMSLNNIDYASQLEGIEEGGKFTVPQQNLELSSCTETQSKLITNNLSTPDMPELTDNININFSVLQTVGNNDIDDLEEIQKDLKRFHQSNVSCPGPSKEKIDMLQGAKIDLNMTHVQINEESDMSITDIITSPKIQVSENSSNVKNETPLNRNEENWLADKENIVVNPYVAPQEEDNFFTEKTDDDILVFDGKKIYVQSNKEPVNFTEENQYKTTRCESNMERKTIVLNVNDDLPNFVDNVNISNFQSLDENIFTEYENKFSKIHREDQIKIKLSNGKSQSERMTLNVNDDLPNFIDVNVLNDNKFVGIVPGDSFSDCVELSNAAVTVDENKQIGALCEVQNMTDKSIHFVNSNLIDDSRKQQNVNKTIIYEDENNISMTQVLTNVPSLSSDKQKTIIFENDQCDLSMTQALPVNFWNQNIPAPTTSVLPSSSERRNTIIFESDQCDISMTQALPTNILNHKTQVPPTDVLQLNPDRQKTIIFESNQCDISVTQALPTNILNYKTQVPPTDVSPLNTDKQKTIVFENDQCNLSITQALPAHIWDQKTPATSVLPSNSGRRNTIIFESDQCDISMTQALPTNILSHQTQVPPADVLPLNTDRQKTIIFESDQCDISITQALPTNILNHKTNIATTDALQLNPDKQKTIVFENDQCDLSITQALPAHIRDQKIPESLTNVLPSNSGRQNTIIFESDQCDISMTQALPTNILNHKTHVPPTDVLQSNPDRQKTIIFESDQCDISVTQALPTNILNYKTQVPPTDVSPLSTDQQKTIVFENDQCDLSITQALPAHIRDQKIPEPLTNVLPSNSGRRNTIIFECDQCDISMTQALPTNILNHKTQVPPTDVLQSNPDRQKTIIFESNQCDISVTEALPTNILNYKTQVPPTDVSLLSTDKQKTILFENEQCDLSITQALPAHIRGQKTPEPLTSVLSSNSGRRNTIIFESNQCDISVTQALPTNILNYKTQVPPTDVSPLSAEKQKTIVFENDQCDLSITQVLPAHIWDQKTPATSVLPSNSGRRNTIIFESDQCNISMTQALPTNILSHQTQVPPADVLPLNTDRQKTTIFESDQCDISITQALPTNILNHKTNNDALQLNPDKQKTIVFENDQCDFSMTEALPANIRKQNTESSITGVLPLNSAKQNTVIFESDQCDISLMQALSANISIQNECENSGKKKSFKGITNISLEQALPGKIVCSNEIRDNKNVSSSIDEVENMSVTVGEDIVTYNDSCNEKRNIIDSSDESINRALTKEHKESKVKTIIYDSVSGSISSTQVLSTNIVESSENLRKTIVCNDESEYPSVNIGLIDDPIKIKEKSYLYEDNFQNDNTEHLNTSLSKDVPVSVFMSSELQRNNTERKFINNNELKKLSPQQMKSPNASSSNDIQCESTSKFKLEFESMSHAEIGNPALNDLHNGRIEKLIEQSYGVKQTEIVPAKSTITEVVDQSKIENSDILKINDKFIKDRDITEISRNLENVDISTLDKDKVDMKNNVEFEQDLFKVSTTKPIFATRFTVQNNGISDKKKGSFIADAGNDIIVYQAITSPSIANVQQTAQEDLKLETISVNSKSFHEIEKTQESNSLMTSLKMSNDGLTGVERGYLLQNDTVNKDIIEKPANNKQEPRQDVETDTPLLNELLDMSSASLVEMSSTSLEEEYLADGIEDKNILVKINSPQEEIIVPEKPSDISLFFTINDDDDNRDVLTQTNYLQKVDCANNQNLQILKAVPEIGSKAELNSTQSKTCSVEKKSNVSLGSALDDTGELLDLLSNFTKTRTSKQFNDNENMEMSPINEKTLKALENKIDASEQEYLSFAPITKCNILSKENISNISLAQSALQKSRIGLNESDFSDTEISARKYPSKKSVRMSSDVVKTLNFDDDSITDLDIDSPKNLSPIKKSAFGETPCMLENKAKVIPSYLKDVTDGLKQTMNDLVKPVNDIIPFDSNNKVDNNLKTVPSTCSTQVQANLVTSSQIELDFCTRSNSEQTQITQLDEKMEIEQTHDIDCDKPESESSRVLFFDPANPLNNVLLAPIDFSEAHKYNPIKPSPTPSVHSDDTLMVKMDTDKIATQYNVSVPCYKKELFDIDMTDVQSQLSNSSKQSADGAVDVHMPEVQSIECNTVIVMRENKELLEASSSLILVEDAQQQQFEGVSLNTLKNITQNKSINSISLPKGPDQNVINLNDSNVATQYESIDLTSPKDSIKDKIVTKDGELTNIENSKAKKRSLCSIKTDNTIAVYNIEVTPKPNNKVQRTSGSPTAFHSNVQEKTECTSVKLFQQKQSPKSSLENKESPNKPKTETRTSNAMHNVLTEYKDSKENTENKIIKKKILKTLSNERSKMTIDSSKIKSPELIDSFTSSKNQQCLWKREISSATVKSGSGSTVMTNASSMQGCKSTVMPSAVSRAEYDPGVSVVANINRLPFMGTEECEWESAEEDTWVFKVMCTQLRLVVQFEHSAYNTTKKHVQADTLVRAVTVQNQCYDKKSPEAALCIRYATETIRFWIGRAPVTIASDLVLMLKRVAAVARLALRWARAMRDSKLPLMFSLDHEGLLTFKVMNVPFRTIWEVSMRIELVVSNAQESPWPRASSISVKRIIGQRDVREEEITRIMANVPCDWGHAPRALWRIFKYLKYRNREQDFFFDISSRS